MAKWKLCGIWIEHGSAVKRPVSVTLSDNQTGFGYFFWNIVGMEKGFILTWLSDGKKPDCQKFTCVLKL